MFNGGKKEIPFRAYVGNEPYVFVAYAHADCDVVYPIIKEIHRRGVRIWYDEGIDIGSEWPQEIADSILGCKKFLLFMSPNAAESNHVRQEINFANSKRKQILPVYLEPALLSSGLELTLSVFQAIFHYAFKGKEDEFFTQICGALLDNPEAPETTEATVLGAAVLRLDEYGDKTLPHVIHLPDKGKFSIGRYTASAGIQKSDFEFARDKTNISRRHAEFNCGEQNYTLTDLGSTAGTWVNGKRIPPNVPVTVSHGLRIAFGTAGASYIFEDLRGELEIMELSG